MDFECSRKGVCEAGAFIEEATILAQLPNESIQDLGWTAASRVVINAAFDTLAELSEAELAAFRESLPTESERCEDCYLKRNNLLRTLLDKTPDTLSD